MIILGIETSCDETAVSLIKIDEKGSKVEILGNTVLSQMELHAPYGGVFPVLAKREHQKNLVPVLLETLKQANFLKETKKRSEIDASVKDMLKMESELLSQFEKVLPTIEKPAIDLISVTAGPGLEPALWVGINFARALGTLWDIPIVPANHMEGHILISLLKENGGIVKPKFPAIALLISGGHTEFILINKIGEYKKIGETRDDAVGECFDKTARMLGLPYPGGPEISKRADEARKKGFELSFKLPRPMIHSDDFDFSFSGLKTSVLYATKDKTLSESMVGAFAREIEDAITETLVYKTSKIFEKYGPMPLIIGGGVIANGLIREGFEKLAAIYETSLYIPKVDHSTDNALMIALVGYFEKHTAQKADTSIKANGNLSL